MHDLIHQLIEYARGMWRFRRAAVVAAWAICLLGWLVVLLLPNRYEARARVFVDPTTSLRPVIENLAVQQDVSAELALVRQLLLSDAQLQTVVDKVGLGQDAHTPQQKAAVIEGLRNRIEIPLSSFTEEGSNRQSQSRTYSLVYQDVSRDRALQVVGILLDTFVNDTLGGKREGAQQAQQFLESQIQEYEARLTEAEARLAEFKKNNVGLVPTQTGGQQTDYFTRLQVELDAVKQAQTALNAAYSRRDALQKQLRGEAPVAASGGGSVGINGTSISTGGNTLSRIKETQAKLDELLLRFTEKHPDVIATRQNLADLQVRRESELEALRRGDPNAAAVTGASSNPVYQSIQLALNQATIEIATAQAELRDRQQKVSELRRMVDTMPQVEAQYAQLNRDYGAVKQQYEALVDRLEKARVGEQADASGSVRFEVIDPPTADYTPVSPQRALLTLGVLVAGIGAAVGIAFVLNMLKPVYQTVQGLADATGLTVLGSVSLSRSGAQQAVVRAAYLRYAAMGGVLVFLTVLVVLIGSKFAPLLGDA